MGLARRPARRGKEALAADVWARMVEYSMRHQRHVQSAREAGLTPGDAKLLFDLEPGRPRSMRDLAETFACDASNVTWMVDRLEERGLVERRTLPTDRRVKTVVLTLVGEKTKAQLLERLYEPPSDLVELPRSDLEALRTALTKLPT